MYRRWHPQIALRYFPIVRFLKRLNVPLLSVLEVGSGSLGIGPYWKGNVTAIDVDFSGPQWKNLQKISGSGIRLPLKNDSVDVALSVDMLEHIRPQDRPQVIAEMIRVSKRAVIMAVPMGKAAQVQDQALHRLYQKKFGKPFKFLAEQVDYGLPTDKQVRHWLHEGARRYEKKIGLRVQGNRNLKLRWWLMQGWMSKNMLTNVFFRKVLLLFLPILKVIDRRPPHYRQMFFATIHS